MILDPGESNIQCPRIIFNSLQTVVCNSNLLIGSIAGFPKILFRVFI
jgi:hypothetical protein